MFRKIWSKLCGSDGSYLDEQFDAYMKQRKLERKRGRAYKKSRKNI